MMRVIAIKNGIRCEILLGDLVSLIAAEVKAALLEEGFVSRADLEEREERMRQVARLGHGRDNVRIVQ